MLVITHQEQIYDKLNDIVKLKIIPVYAGFTHIYISDIQPAGIGKLLD